MYLQWLVLVLVLALIAADHFVVWRAFVKEARIDGTRARRTLWMRTAILMWVTSALVLGFWLATGVPMQSVGLGLPVGWRLWIPLAVGAAFVALQVNSAVKLNRVAVPNEKLRARLGAGIAAISPRTVSELPGFFGVSLTAGFCEELLFRGFLIWVMQPVAGLGMAAVAAAMLFGVAHSYQGLGGVIRTGLFGLVFTAIVLVTRSLWPAIVLHAAVDAMGGVIAWLVLREPVQQSPALEASAS
jgi:membrane protease YdiL (CAAX protease family)